MMAIQLRFDVARELLLLLCLLVLLGSSLGLLRVDFPGLWFALGSVPVVLCVVFRRRLHRFIGLAVPSAEDC